jgi:hypothetical protein
LGFPLRDVYKISITKTTLKYICVIQSMTLRITMNAKDVAAIYGCSVRTAHRIINSIRKEQKIKDGQKITVHQYATHYKVDAQHILIALNPSGGIN